MIGYQVATIDDVVGEVDIFITTTGNFKIITLESMKKMKNNAIVGNIGHFDNEIEMDKLESFPGIKVDNIKPQVDRFVFPDGHGIIMLASGRLCNLGCATGHPSFVMSACTQSAVRIWLTFLLLTSVFVTVFQCTHPGFMVLAEGYPHILSSELFLIRYHLIIRLSSGYGI